MNKRELVKLIESVVKKQLNEGEVKPNWGAIKKWWNTPLEYKYNDFLNGKSPKEWNTDPVVIDGYGKNAGADLFSKHIMDYTLAHDGSITNDAKKLMSIFGFNKIDNLYDYIKENNGSGFNGDKNYKKYKSLRSAFYDIYDEITSKV